MFFSFTPMCTSASVIIWMMKWTFWRAHIGIWISNGDGHIVVCNIWRQISSNKRNWQQKDTFLKCIVHQYILSLLKLNRNIHLQSIKCIYCVCGTWVKSSLHDFKGITDNRPSLTCNVKFVRSNSESDFNGKIKIVLPFIFSHTSTFFRRD